jgi:hypothetical protein
MEVAALAILGMSKIWLERNARTFDQQVSTVEQVLKNATEEFQLWVAARNTSGFREEVVLCICLVAMWHFF